MPVAYLSTQFNGTQFKWSTVVKEGFAIYHAIKEWRHYLEEAEVLLKSDAKSLQKFLNKPLKDEDISINAVQTEDDITCCPLCEVDLTDTKTLQHEDKHCIRIAKLIVDPESRFNERDSYGYDDKGILYHINRENGKEYKATVV